MPTAAQGWDLSGFAASISGEPSSAGSIAYLILQQAGGLLLLLSLATSPIIRCALSAISPAEALIGLALVVGTNPLVQKLHASGPLAVVAAGLVVGDRPSARRYERAGARQRFAL